MITAAVAMAMETRGSTGYGKADSNFINTEDPFLWVDIIEAVLIE